MSYALALQPYVVNKPAAARFFAMSRKRHYELPLPLFTPEPCAMASRRYARRERRAMSARALRVRRYATVVQARTVSALLQEGGAKRRAYAAILRARRRFVGE